MSVKIVKIDKRVQLWSNKTGVQTHAIRCRNTCCNLLQVMWLFNFVPNRSLGWSRQSPRYDYISQYNCSPLNTTWIQWV